MQVLASHVSEVVCCDLLESLLKRKGRMLVSAWDRPPRPVTGPFLKRKQEP